MKKIFGSILMTAIAVLLCLGLSGSPANAATATALGVAQDWRGDERDAYSRGYNDGYSDSSRGRSNDDRRYRDHYSSRTERAYRSGYTDGFEEWRQIRARRGNTIDEQREAYEAGFSAGKRDYRLNYGKSPLRHRDMFDSRTERSFRRGYDEGFEAKQISTGTFSRGEKEAYDNGVELGEEDYRNRQSRNYQRYRDRYDRRYESDFAKGYDTGYEKARAQREHIGAGENSFYDRGFSRGQDDRLRNRSRDYRRYRHDYDSRSEEFFRRGYEAGFDDARSGRGGGGRTEQDAYEQGYRLGRQDKDERLNRDYRRWRQYYDSHLESTFKRGYDAGYNSR